MQEVEIHSKNQLHSSLFGQKEEPGMPMDRMCSLCETDQRAKGSKYDAKGYFGGPVQEDPPRHPF